jgi:hypothetical protein
MQTNNQTTEGKDPQQTTDKASLDDAACSVSDSLEDDEDIADEHPTVCCKFCHTAVREDTAHIHQDGWVGDECCWDERLRSTE